MAPFSYEIPTRRTLKVFAFDPMLGRAPLNRVAIDIGYEPLAPGPVGSRLRVIDYDSGNKCFYPPVDLEDSALLMQNGMEPTESDPRFHQQMVYAVAMKVIENFEAALGRRLTFRKGRRLRLFPHAFQGPNAFYDPRLVAILFGYFHADKENPGANVPGQTVFSCLSQDVVAHEMTHAIVDRLRHYFMEATNRDVLAFHEGFADIVAIFQHFSFPAILREVIQQTRSNLHSSKTMVDLAQQFGYATGRGQALRTSIENSEPTRDLYQRVTESHERGSILVAAVFEAFFKQYQKRIRDLIRIATGGTGTLPEGDLHPDLVNRIAIEAAGAAQSTLRMCIRAFDYLPPVDVTFGDYLRALVTADYELSPNDDTGLREATIEAFRVRGICPVAVNSLAQDSLRWERAPAELPLFPTESMGELILRNFDTSVSLESVPEVKAGKNRVIEQIGRTGISSKLAAQLREYANTHSALLGLDPALDKRLHGFHPVFRVAPRGELVVEMVAQFTVVDRSKLGEFGGVPLRGGATLIASADGRVQYVISKPLPTQSPSPQLDLQFQREARARHETQREFIDECDCSDDYLPWADDGYREMRIAKRMNFALTHMGITR